MILKFVLLGFCLFVTETFAQKNNLVELGKLQTGEKISFFHTSANDWGMEISGGNVPLLTQRKPVMFSFYQNDEDIHDIAVGYKTIHKSDSGIIAYTEVTQAGNVVFHVTDCWYIDGNVVSVNRKVKVEGNTAGGFNSSVAFTVDPETRWTDMNCLAPGALYGDPTYNGERSPGGTLNNAAHQFLMREDILPAPLFALSFRNGSSVTMLDPSPQGESTVEETKLSKDVMIDAKFLFGRFGVWQIDERPIEFGFQYPGTANIYSFDPNKPPQSRMIRRFHPINQGVKHSYVVSFRFGKKETFQNLIRNSWRWAWNNLKPAVTIIDVEQVRQILADHLLAQAATIDGRTAIPFAVATYDTSTPQWNWIMAGLGFVSKNIECADQLLREGDRDHSERGLKMRQTGLAIISSMIQSLPTVPLQATGYNLATGKPWNHIWLAPWLRNATEDMRVLMKAYLRERSHGIQHPEWFNWIKLYVDWLISQQREDGSFPRRWKSGSDVVAESTGSTSYCPVPLLLLMAEETNDFAYINAAIRAGEYIWTNWGSRGLFVGGTSDNPNITDKEAGMLSMEAYLSLYESTKEKKWLDRAKVSADYTESWIWIWNLPMPLDADDVHLHWKKGVPTVGLQGISARGPGGVDEYLDWSASSYAKLYKYTNDEHYLEVARILLHNTKAMVALPGRQYDMKGIGWQQEHWGMGPGIFGRGVGGHRFWLPWISANHLYSINGIEELDSALFLQMIKGK